MSQGQKSLAESLCLLEHSPSVIIPPKSSKNQSELVWVSYLFTEGKSVRIDLFDFRVCLPLHQHQCRSNFSIQEQFLPEALRCVGQPLKHLQPITEMTNGFCMG